MTCELTVVPPHIDGQAYLETYSEIPVEPVTDPYLAVKRLGGHLRQFDPQQTREQQEWFIGHYPALCRAYGEARVDNFLEGLTRPEAPVNYNLPPRPVVFDPMHPDIQR